MIRIVLADDQALVRSGILALLRQTEDLEVVAEALDGYEAIDAILRTHPEVALLDVRMPGASGLDALRELRRRRIEVKVILLTSFDDDPVMREALRLGAAGWLLKDIPVEDLAAAIRAVAAGRRTITAVGAGAAELLRAEPPSCPAGDLPVPLSDVELEVLRLIARGLSNREIAQARGTAPGTVKNQASAIFQKLGVHDRTRAVLRAAELALL